MVDWNTAAYLEIKRAFDESDVETFQRLLKRHPQYLREENGSDMWLWKAAMDGDLAVINALIELGLDVNETDWPPGHSSYEPEGAIQRAANKGHLEVVRWLLDHGAKINFEFKGQRRCWPLVGAATFGHLDVVKLLVERGADLNATYNNVNAVTQAETYGQFEIRDYLLSLGARDIRETTPPDFRAAHELLREELAGDNGASANWRIDLPGAPVVTIYHTPPTEDAPYETLFTVGLSDKNLPEDRFRFGHNEVRLMLKRGWKLDATSLSSPQWNWPVEWLKRIVTELRSGEKWPDDPTLFMNGDAPQPLIADTQMCGWICLHSQYDASFTLPDHRIAVIWDLFPIYAEEAEFVRQHNDSEDLVNLFHDCDIPLYVDPLRKNAVE